jgi:hypothetical protein
MQNAEMTLVFSQNRRLAGASASAGRLDREFALISHSWQCRGRFVVISGYWCLPGRFGFANGSRRALLTKFTLPKDEASTTKGEWTRHGSFLSCRTGKSKGKETPP